MIFNKIKKLISKYSPKLVITASVILAIIMLINFHFIFEITAQSNDECLWISQKISDDSVAIVFDLVKENGVTWKAGIRNGDVLLTIDNIDIKNTFGATQILDRFKKGEFAPYRVSRNGNIFETQVEVKKLINLVGLGFGLLSLIWLCVGFIVIMAKPDGYTQLIFYRIGATACLFSFFNFLYRGDVVPNPIFQSIPLVIGIDIIWTFGASFLPFLITHFFWSFPKEWKILRKKWVTKALYIVPVILFVVSIIIRFIFVYNAPASRFQILINFHFLLVLLGLLVGLISLYISYFRLRTATERRPIFIILVSYTLGLAAIIFTLTLANALTDTIFNSPEYFMPIVIAAIIPISFGYSIFRHSLMDVSEVIKKAILYGAATLTVAGIYFFVIYFLGQRISTIIGTEYQGIAAALFFILFAIMFQSTKDRFQNLITRQFYPEQFAYQKVLLKFSKDVTTIVGLENILDSTHNTFVESLKLKKFGILLKNTDKNIYELRRGIGIENKGLKLNNQEEKISGLLLHKESLHLLPVIEQSEFKNIFPENCQNLIEEQIYTIIPLWIKSKIIGLLLFGLKYSGAQFAGEDLELLTAAANQTAVSIENARLYQSELEKIKIETDLDNARKIQQSLLPAYVPQVESLELAGRMIPAMQVGGDYYDLIKVSDNKLFVIVGDVSGKGLAASFYMSKLQTMMRLYCTEYNTPKKVLTEINKRIYESIQRNWFITISIALFDTKARTVNYCRAGHTPLIHINDFKIQYYQSQGIGVGLEKGDIFDSSLSEINLPLQANDLYIFFSDGVNESMNEKNELFGIEKLEDTILKFTNSSSEKLLSEIIASINTHRGAEPPNDDITLVVVKVGNQN